MAWPTRGVSAYPQAVTGQMVANFAAGGAAINQIATLAGAELRVVPIELDRPTRDFTVAAAMDDDEFLAAVDIGYRTVPEDCDLLAVGEMGIANTTTAAMLCAALLGGGAARWAGRGTGVDDDGLARKRAAIEAALNLHRAILGRSARGGRGARRARTRRDSRRGARGAAPPDPRAARRVRGDRGRRCRWRALRPACWIIAAPGTSPPNPAIANCCANSGSTPLLDLNMRLGEASGRRRRDPAAARGAGLSCRNGHIRRSRRFRRGRLTKPCRTSRR